MNLQKVGVKQLKYVVATHFHADHLGGLYTIVRDFSVESVYVPNGDADTAVYREFIQSCMDRNLKPSVPLPNSSFKFLNVKGGYDNLNNNSLIVELTSGNTKSLFTGDAEKEVETTILQELPDIDILKVAHHGSSSSTTEAFLNQVKPEVAIIQTAEGNKYGHPHIETMQKLQSRAITVHRNDECGDIVYTIDNEGYNTECTVIGSYNNGNKQTSTVESSSNSGAVSNTNNSTQSTTSKVEPTTTNSSSKEVVYITNTGKKYHRGGCRTLKSKIESTIDAATAKGLTPCGVCNP